MILEQFSFSALASRLELEYLGPENISAKRFSTDTRTIQPGDLFVAISGENFDGNTYIELAIEKGAVGVISQKHIEGVPTFLCKDSLVTMQSISQLVFKTYLAKNKASVAITGSNGKTTTKELLRAISAPFFSVHATRGNFNNHIGVPITLSEIPSDADLVIIEMGANKSGDIRELITLAPTHDRIITSISEAHLGGFGSLDGVIKTKSEIFEKAQPNTRAIIPKALEGVINFEKFEGEIYTVGEGDDVDLELKILNAYQTRFIEHRQTPGVEPIDIVLTSSLAGRHNAINLGLAIATLVNRVDRSLDLKTLWDDALYALVLPDGRSRHVFSGGHSIFDDAYNANTASIKASLSTWLEINPKQVGVDRIAIIGEMFEMGSDSKSIHEKLAAWIGMLDIDVLVFLGSFHDTMAVCSQHENALGFIDAKMAAKWLKKRSPSEVFLKGSRGMKLETIIDDLKNES